MDIAAAESNFVRVDAHLVLNAPAEHASHLPPEVPVSHDYGYGGR